MNKMELKFSSTLDNESLARNAVITFISCLNPTLDEIGEIKTIVSEAVSNSIIHGYNFDEDKDIILRCEIEDYKITLTIIDFGVGIKDLSEAKRPHYSSRPDLERAGMGLTIMETLSDEFDIRSVYGMGTKIIMTKEIYHDPVLQGEGI